MKKVKFTGNYIIVMDGIGEWKPDEVKEIFDDSLADKIIGKSRFEEVRDDEFFIGNEELIKKDKKSRGGNE